MRPTTLRTLTGGILLALAATVLLVAPASAASITASRTSVIAGESVRITGALGTRGVRPVKLQRRAGTSWVNIQSVRSTSRGRFAFVVRPSGAVGAKRTYRAFAPKTRINGRRLAAVATTARTVTMVAQTATLTGPTRVTTGKPFSLVATLRPVRPGRTTILQAFSAGVWTELKRGVQTSAGTTTFGVTLSALGSQPLRAVAAASLGATARTSATLQVTVLPPALQRASESAAGAQSNGYSAYPSVSADGRYAVFLSAASNLVPNDTNGVEDTFVRDLETGAVERVSVSSTGAQASTGAIEGSAISADGRYVVFESTDSALDPDQQASSIPKLYLRDRVTGITELVSITASGAPATSNSYHPSVSADGTKVAFASVATNMVAGDTNGKGDVFVRDRVAGTTTRISVDSDGGEANGASTFPKISANGSYVTYTSLATNLAPDDTNATSDVFFWSESSQTTHRVSEDQNGVGGNGRSGGPSISADGRYIAYYSMANNLVASDTNNWDDVFVYDRVTFATEIVTLTSAGAQVFADVGTPSISSDGRYVSFASGGALVTGDTNGKSDIYVRDRTNDTVRWVSTTTGGGNADDNSNLSAISGDGRMVVFTSLATNLVPGDTNGLVDVYARDLNR